MAALARSRDSRSMLIGSLIGGAAPWVWLAQRLCFSSSLAPSKVGLFLISGSLSALCFSLRMARSLLMLFIQSDSLVVGAVHHLWLAPVVCFSVVMTRSILMLF